MQPILLSKIVPGRGMSLTKKIGVKRGPERYQQNEKERYK